MGIRLRRTRRVALCLAALAALFVFVSLPPRAPGKTQPAPASQQLVSALDPPPSARLVAIEPEAQREGHTCGLHALRMAYASYGVDPDELDLRKRLGVDTPAIRWLGSTTGMLPQDLLRVLDQDGFTWRLLAPDEERAAATLAEHIQGEVALAVVPFGADFHWVTLRPGRDAEPQLLDPAGGTAESLSVSEFLDERALSVVLIRVRRGGDPPNKVVKDGLLQLRDIARRSAAK